MKMRYFILGVLILEATLCFGNSLELSVMNMEAVNKDNRFPNYYKYNVLLSVKNKSTEPLFFWTWSCSWQLNFIFIDAIMPPSCKSNISIVSTFLPHMNYIYKSCVYSKHKILNKDDISFGFVYIPGYKYTVQNVIYEWDKIYTSKALPANSIIWNNSLLLLRKTYFRN